MMKKIRKEDVLERLKEIEAAVSIVEDSLPDNLDEFMNLGLLKDGIYKKIEFALENVIDICYIINSDLRLGIPADDSDVIKNLEIKKVLSKELAKKIQAMKSFRNILVHRYGKINDESAFEILNEELPDFQYFKKEILRFLEKVEKNGRKERR